MKTYTFSSDKPYDEIEGALDSAAGALEDLCYPEGDRQAKIVRDLLATLSGDGMTPDDWAKLMARPRSKS